MNRLPQFRPWPPPAMMPLWRNVLVTVDPYSRCAPADRQGRPCPPARPPDAAAPNHLGPGQRDGACGVSRRDGADGTRALPRPAAGEPSISPEQQPCVLRRHPPGAQWLVCRIHTCHIHAQTPRVSFGARGASASDALASRLDGARAPWPIRESAPSQLHKILLLFSNAIAWVAFVLACAAAGLVDRSTGGMLVSLCASSSVGRRAVQYAAYTAVVQP